MLIEVWRLKKNGAGVGEERAGWCHENFLILLLRLHKNLHRQEKVIQP